MSALTRLDHLEVQNNALTSLPSWTGSLPIAFLDATNNSLSELPAVGVSMNHLYLYQNPINATSRQVSP